MEKKLYKLTSSQENIFMREQFYNGTAINNLSFTFYIKADLDEKTCCKVLNKIVEKNEGLRMQIEINEKGHFQYVSPFIRENFAIRYFSNSSIEDLKPLMEKDACIPFIFENSKLYKFVIFKLKDNETAIYIKLHHIIGDAWVTKIFFEQFNNLYIAYSNKKHTDLDAFSYIDFINSENEYMNSPVYEKDLAFWEKYVKDIPEAIPFKEICNKKTSISKRFTGKIDFSDEINTFCKKNSISPYSFFMAMYSIYLYKAQSKTDFTIGTPLLNRKNHIERNTFGMFVSTVPLKIHIEDDIAIIDFINKLSLTLFGFLRHERFPYEKILDLAHNVNNNNTSNLFDTILSFQNIRPDKDFDYYEFNNIWNFSACQQTSLELHITDYNGKGFYSINLDYNENFCNEQEIVYVFDRLKNIAKQILKSSNKYIKDVQFMDDSEKEIILNNFNHQTSFVPSKALIELFDEQVKKYPNKIAIKFKDESLSYSELNDRVNIFATHLINSGIQGNIPVSIVVERSLDMVVSMLATLRVGAYYITIDPFWPNDRIAYIIENSKSKYLITHRKYSSLYPNSNCICVEDIDYTVKAKNIKFPYNMNDFIYVIYTSGSTGKPKGTMMTNTNIGNLLNSTYQNFHQDENDVWTLFHTYTFDFSAWEIYGCLTHGGTLIVVPKETTINPESFLDLVINEKVTILNQTPAYFYKVIDAEKLSNKKISDLRLIILGGEAVFAEPLRYWKNKYKEILIYNGYGPTETTIFAIMGEITSDDIENNNIFIGKPLDNYKITIVDKNLNPLGFGCEGEICITSRSVCSGYFNNSKMTQEKFINGTNKDGLVLYKSGDVGYWNLDGRIKYIGRNDNQVKIRGFRVELEEIEKELLACEDVSRAVVFPIENSNYTKSLVGFIETKKENYTNDVLEMIKKDLTSYMIPKLYQVSEMPINDNGKIDRKKLLENIVIEKTEIVAPRNQLEKEIHDYICKIKRIKEVSVEADFFQDIGLDSLDIMQLATDLSKYNIEIQRINNNSSIAKLAEAIEKNKKDVNYISELYNINLVNKKFKYDLSNVLLTGSTGFLGSHILKELIDNPKVKNIYCFVRAKENMSSEQRLRKNLEFYFDDPIDYLMKKIKVVSGNFEKQLLGLSIEDYTALSKEITTIIHSGANVKHYGNYDSFYETNVVGTENIIKFAYDSNAKLAHISTLSIAGFSDIREKKINFLDENEININQKFNNHVYMITKYEAECSILDAIDKQLISAKIFRLGNIMPRYSDGKFQTNLSDNAFLARLKTMINTGFCPEIMENLSIDLSPVDLCAKAIMKLLEIDGYQTVYHIFNGNTLKIKNIAKIFHIKFASKDKEIQKIKEDKNPYNAILLNDLINQNYIETPSRNKITTRVLRHNGFRWKKIDENYLKNIYKIISSK